VLAAFVVLFREGFEASLLVAIVLAYLAQIGYEKGRRQVWYGVGAAVAVSLGLSGFLFATVGELEGPAEKIIRGLRAVSGGGLFDVHGALDAPRVAGAGGEHQAGCGQRRRTGRRPRACFPGLIMVLREGVETGLFVFGIARASTPLQTAIGAAAGILAAVGLGYAVYALGTRINLGAFFKYTGAFLIIVAAGLLAQGVVGLQEAGVIPAFFYPLWDVSEMPVLGATSAFGQCLGILVGWDPRPDLLEFVVWLIYLLVVGYAFFKPQESAAERGTQPALSA
jgi:high-affinity iron transporter